MVTFKRVGLTLALLTALASLSYSGAATTYVFRQTLPGNPVPSCSEPGSKSFTTPGVYQVTVPAGCEIAAVLAGAGGGNPTDADLGGGPGGSVSFNLVSSGSPLTVVVGTAGQIAYPSSEYSGGNGGGYSLVASGNAIWGAAYASDEDDFERHWEESGGSPAPTAQAEPSPDIYEAGADVGGSVSSLEADYAPGQETRFDAEMERGRGGAAEVTSASTPLQEQVVTVKLELQPADAETLTTWLSDMQAKAKTDLELGVSVEVGVSVSMDAAMALIDAATGSRPDNMDLTPAMLREALMKIVKP